MLVEQYDYAVDRITKYGDGDSFWCVVKKDMGFHVEGQANIHVRVLHVDTPERGQPNYQEATVFTNGWLSMHLPHLRLLSVEEDSFGRWLSEVYDSMTGERLSDALKAAQLTKPGSVWNKHR